MHTNSPYMYQSIDCIAKYRKWSTPITYTVRLFHKNKGLKIEATKRVVFFLQEDQASSQGVHGVSRYHPDAAAVDEVDDGVQLPEVLAGGLHLDPQHPRIPSLRARVRAANRQRDGS
jgi:hypothetical protein